MYRLFKPVHPLILASNSPRRHEILTNLGIPFKVFHRKVHAEYSELKNPEKFVVALAEQKSHEPAGQISEGIVVTADTIVYIDKTILGKPDFSWKKHKVAIFCDSSFWHGYRFGKRFKETIKVRKKFWYDKIESNRKRDRFVTRELRKQGWKIVRFWDFQIKKDIDSCIKRIKQEIEK